MFSLSRVVRAGIAALAVSCGMLGACTGQSVPQAPAPTPPPHHSRPQGDRLPDAPTGRRDSSAPRERPATTPPQPASPPPAAQSPAPGPSASAADDIRFYVQFTERGDKPQSRGLRTTLRYPRDLNFHLDETRIVYEWRPADGKERQANPRSGEVWGPIWKQNVAEQLQPEHMARHIATMGPWLDTWVPRDFDGIVCIDFEMWTLRDDPHHALAGQRELNARLAPGKSQADLMREFVRATEREARRLRPHVREWGWWGLGGMHPMFPQWRPNEWAQGKEEERRWSGWLLDIQAPMPVFYPHRTLPMSQREAMQREVAEMWKRLYGQERMARAGYAYLSAWADDPTPDGRQGVIGDEEFRMCARVAREMGMRRFIVWAAIDDARMRDELQAFIDNTLAPLMREWNAR